jgi:hypothetical protein
VHFLINSELEVNDDANHDANDYVGVSDDANDG